MDFNEKLIYLRKESGLTQQELADKLYVSRTAVSKWESGKGYPNIESLRLLASELEVSIDVLLSEGSLEQYLIETERDNKITYRYKLSYVLDSFILLFLIIPIYSTQSEGYYYSVPLLLANDMLLVIKVLIFILIIVITLTGFVGNRYIITGHKLNVINSISMVASLLLLVILIASHNPYAAVLNLIHLALKTYLRRR